MRLIVLDTNVIVSAGIQPGGAPAILVRDWVLRGQVQTVTSPLIVGEYRDIVLRVKFRRYEFPPPWLQFLVKESLFLPDPENWPAAGRNAASPDPKDIPFLAVAHTAGAWLVTGNLKHFPAAARCGVRVLSPAEYLRHLGGI